MPKAAGRRKPSRPARSIKKNIALLIVSVSILAGATWLFINIIGLPDLPFRVSDISPREIISSIKARLGKSEVEDRHIAKADSRRKKTEASISENEFRYSFYDILYHQKKPKAADSRFSILIEEFKSRKSAQEFAKGLEKDKKLTCRIARRDGLYAVIWGGFETSDDAKRYSSMLSDILDRECEVAEIQPAVSRVMDTQLK